MSEMIISGRGQMLGEGKCPITRRRVRAGERPAALGRETVALQVVRWPSIAKVRDARSFNLRESHNYTSERFSRRLLHGVFVQSSSHCLAGKRFPVEWSICLIYKSKQCGTYRRTAAADVHSEHCLDMSRPPPSWIFKNSKF